MKLTILKKMTLSNNFFPCSKFPKLKFLYALIIFEYLKKFLTLEVNTFMLKTENQLQSQLLNSHRPYTRKETES